MKKINKKYLALGISLLLFLAVGVTIALSKDVSNILTNTFLVGTIESEIKEENPTVDGTIINKEPRVVNTGSSDALVRVRVVVSPEELWSPDDNTKPININIDTDDWEYNSTDGYYYYQDILESDDVTGIPVFTEVTGVTDSEGKWSLTNVDNFEITVYQETIATKATSSNGETKYSAVNDDGTFNADHAKEIWEIYDSLRDTDSQ